MLIKPKALVSGANIGVFTPSYPAHVLLRNKYLHGLSVLKGLGFGVVEGTLTRRVSSEGYRSGSPRERADEFMGLIRDKSIQCLISTIGGDCSASMIPFLDFDEIRANPKIICGYSDVTSLHMALLAYSNLSTFYGPAVVPSFGEWPTVMEETSASFTEAVQGPFRGPRQLKAPKQWSNHFRDARGDAWKAEPRKFEENPGWNCLNPGEVTAPVIVANLNTLLTSAGTNYFPDLSGKILLIEEMNAPMERLERNYRHLERLGVFGVLKGLIIGKPEVYSQESAPFSMDELLLEVIGPQLNFPIISNFDCGHTHPSLTIAEMTSISLVAKKGKEPEVVINESMVTL